jgi:uncharacterized membrane protein
MAGSGARAPNRGRSQSKEAVMAATTIARRPARPRTIRTRTISDADLRQSLREGFDDFLTFRGDIVFAGVVYTLIGLAAVIMTMSAPLLPYFFPVVAGVGFLGPIAALGFYELARRRELGETDLHWYNFRDVLKRPSADDMGTVAAALLAIFFAWLLTAGALYAIVFGWVAPASIGDFLAMIFTTEQGWALIAAGAAAGALFGWLVLALSVVALPMLVDCDVSAGEAMRTSWRAVNANRGEMVRWGLIVTGLLVLGSIPLFVGLAVVLPVLGYATWHLYTRLVDRDSIPARSRRRD